MHLENKYLLLIFFSFSPCVSSPSILQEICYLRNLTVLDVTKNKLELLPANFGQLTSLCDLHASENCIEALPDSFGEQ